jgi:GAF domain-containing protein
MDEVADAVACEALDVLGASGVTVVLSHQGNPLVARVLASRGFVADHASREPNVNLSGETITALTVRRRTSLFAESFEELESEAPASARIADRLGVRAIASIPLTVGEQTGAFSVLQDAPRRFSHSDRSFLELLARSCEQGLLRASLFEAEKSARTRSDILQALTATLSGAAAVSDVGSAFLDHALGHLAAGSGALLLLDDRTQTLQSVAIGGSGDTRGHWPDTVPVEASFSRRRPFGAPRPSACRAGRRSRNVSLRLPRPWGGLLARDMQARWSSRAEPSGHTASCSNRSVRSGSRTSDCCP